jgi:hypothetical protein
LDELGLVQHIHQLVDCVFAVAGARLDIVSQYVLSFLDRVRYAFFRYFPPIDSENGFNASSSVWWRGP